MSEAAGPSAVPALRALLAEDSRFDAELLQLQLQRVWPDQVRLHVLQEETAIVGALRDETWDVVLSDYELPGFTGADLLEHRNRLQPETPFIFVSGVIGEDNAVELLKRGATDYVSKSRLERLGPVLHRARREVLERRARQAAEQQLRLADITFAKVVDGLRDYAVILLDMQGRIQFWNQAARHVFGYEGHEVIGQSAALLFPPESMPEQALRQEMQQARTHGKANDDHWLVAKGGRRLWAEGILTTLDNEDGRTTGFCKLVHDRTAAHEAAAALRAAKEEADRANHAKDRFLAVLSHELRTPLAPISTAVHVLEKTVRLEGPHRDLLPMIRRNVALEARLIDDLLDLTAIRSGKVSLKMDRVDAHDLVHAVVAMVADTLEQKAVRLDLRLEAACPYVEGDQARLQQVLWNILRNAAKFTPKGGSVVLRTHDAQGQFALSCTDSGIGIAGDALTRIFQPFEQADSEVSRSYGGLGLGLAIAQGLMREHGGRIEASSPGRGAGATFTLYLPCALAPLAVAPPAAGAEPPTDGPRRVLLVEDNEDAAAALALCLEEYGYLVKRAGTCADALRLARSHTFDVLLTDLGLPDGSGIGVGRALAGTVPAIALSGYGGEQDRARSAQAGFAAHLVKPADPAEVHARISALLSGRNAAA